MKFSVPDPTTGVGALKWIAVIVGVSIVVKWLMNVLARTLPFLADIEAGGTGSAALNAAITRGKT